MYMYICHINIPNHNNVKNLMIANLLFQLCSITSVPPSKGIPKIPYYEIIDGVDHKGTVLLCWQPLFC